MSGVNSPTGLCGDSWLYFKYSPDYTVVYIQIANFEGLANKIRATYSSSDHF